jgi:hypothetical protein
MIGHEKANYSSKTFPVFWQKAVVRQQAYNILGTRLFRAEYRQYFETSDYSLVFHKLYEH